MIQEVSVPIFKVAGLFALVASKGPTAVLERYGVINRVKSLYRAVVLDKDKEDFDRKDLTFAGVADLTDRSVKRVAAEAEIPVTVLLGEAPAGLNATGDSDIRWFFSRIKAERLQIAEPRIKASLRLLLGASSAPKLPADTGIHLVWPSLWEPTEAEKADVYSKNATADAVYIDKQVLLPEEVFLARAGRDGWGSELQFEEEQIELRRAALEPDAPASTETDPNAPAPAPAPAPEDGNVQSSAMNGAQVASLVEIVSAVAAGTLPRDSAVQIIALAYQVTPAEAEAILGSAGTTFKVEKPDAPPSPFDGGKPAVPPAKPETPEAGAEPGTPPVEPDERGRVPSAS
jgi:hypothetical protein